MTPALLLAAAVSNPGAAPPAGASGDEAVDAPAARAAALVEALSSASRAERVRAERDLIALGPAAAALLPPPGSPAAPTGAGALVALERVRAALAADPPPRAGPSRARPSELPTHTLAAALAALAERTGNRLDPTALSPATLAGPAPDLSTIPTEDEAATFWDLLNALAGGRFAIGDAPDGALRLLPWDRNAAAAATSDGVVRVELGTAAVRPRFGTGETLLRVPVRLIAEPRTRALAVSPVGAGLTATADGSPLAPFTPGASRESPFANGVAAFAVDFVAPEGFVTPEGATPRSVLLNGRFDLDYSPGERRFLFAPTDVGIPRTGGGVTVRLDAACLDAGGRSGDAATIAAAVLYDAAGDAPAFESYQTWRYAARVRLRGPAGALEPAGAPETVAEGPAAVAIRARFRLPPGADLSDYQVEVVAPAAPVTAGVRFAGAPVPAAAP